MCTQFVGGWPLEKREYSFAHSSWAAGRNIIEGVQLCTQLAGSRPLQNRGSTVVHTHRLVGSWPLRNRGNTVVYTACGHLAARKEGVQLCTQLVGSWPLEKREYNCVHSSWAAGR